MSDSSRYPILAAESTAEQTLLRSRFLASLCPVSTVAEAQAFIARLRQESPEATHHCWAYLVGPPASTAQVGLSDDGEPHGTAGRPMLDVLTHSGIGDLAAVVSRWFGGTKLGKGGLLRAYSGTVSLALEKAPTTRRTTWIALSLRMAYAQVSAVQHRYPAYEVELLSETFAEDVAHEIRVPAEQQQALESALKDATAGSISIVTLPA